MSQERRAPEFWGGLECTVNRVGERYFDQCERNGHNLRLDDIDRFAELGIRALRYPVLWETTAPDGPSTADWTRADERLERLRTVGVRPIVGLVHHGSGPRHTSLVEPSFYEGLAEFARAVAERYPWVTDFTPVNEPLTTARFSALYGHWYPHGTDYPTFTRALLVQCRAVVDAMRAIREVTPQARLIQTEDMGQTYSTPKLRYQADFENRRRWLSYDLLCGQLDPKHDLWELLLEWGATEAELAYFLEHPTPPDVIGLNYYVTSDRLLDEQLEGYPAWSHGGNHRDAYADVEAVRARPEGIAGHEWVLEAAWARYGLPVALTEVHLGSTREEQLRWLHEAWVAAGNVQARGAAVEAVTVWSLLGAFDWNTLVTAEHGFYEPGVFDVQAPTPRPTALAGLVRELAAGRPASHPALSGPGWWRRPERLHYPAPRLAAPSESAPAQGEEGARPLLIVGAPSPFAASLERSCRVRGLPYQLVTPAEFAGQSKLLTRRPWAAVYAPETERELNAADLRTLRLLNKWCSARGLSLLAFSSSLVLDGRSPEPHLEGASIAPRSPAAEAFAKAETQLLSTALVVRTGPLFGSYGGEVTLASFAALDDALVSPAYLPDVLNVALDLLIDGERGLWHLAPPERVLLSDFTELLSAVGRAQGSVSEAIHRHLRARQEPLPHPNLTLGSVRGGPLPPLAGALERYAREHPANQDAA